MQRPTRRDSTTPEPLLDRFLARVMHRPTLELCEFVQLIANEIAKRRQPTNAPPRPAPRLVKGLLAEIETALLAAIDPLRKLDSLLQPHPDLHHKILHGQFGILSAVGEVHLAVGHSKIRPGEYVRSLSLDDLDRDISVERLIRAARRAARQRENYSLDDTRTEPSADRLCAVAVVNLWEMTRWMRPGKTDLQAWQWCEDLSRISGAPPSESSHHDEGRQGDPLSRWEGHLGWALEETDRPVQRLKAERIIRVACEASGFAALFVPEAQD